MVSRTVKHTCGHERTYTREREEILDSVVKYAQTTVCWDCWIEERKKSGA
jgi:hypothetical protein